MMRFERGPIVSRSMLFIACQPLFARGCASGPVEDSSAVDRIRLMEDGVGWARRRRVFSRRRACGEARIPR
ncbi:MAG: hypothetical protein CL933_19030 [Deltaproteobacteria bacterium]|nr:hypothetical protein [Deltaproteobacteria bacterium]